MKAFLPTILFFVIHTYNCAIFSEKDSGKKLPDLSSVDSEFCKSEEQLYDVSLVIKGNIGSSSWADTQDRLINSSKPEDGDLSIRLQTARAIIAKCAVLLFGAVPTGSARDLSEINLKNAKKDIDMSVPMENVETSNAWLRRIVPEPDRTMELALLMDPIDSLPCRRFKGKELMECAKVNTVQTTKIMLAREVKNLDKHDWTSKKDLDFVCPLGVETVEKNSPDEKILSIRSSKELEELVKALPAKMESTNGFKSGNRYRYFFIALADIAYYLEPESIRRWVIEREDVFKENLKKNYPDYYSAKDAREIETEGAVLEQWLQTSRHGHSFYYKYKYLFRAMDHIGFDVDKQIPELSALHRVLKKTRPETVKDAYVEFLKIQTEKEVQSEKSLANLKKNISLQEFEELVNNADKKQKDALLAYIQKRKKSKETVWGQFCKG
jgi:hypothetical protein